SDGERTRAGLSDIFTPAMGLPLGITTLMISLGWLLVLPPWQNQLNTNTPGEAGNELAKSATENPQPPGPAAPSGDTPTSSSQDAAATPGPMKILLPWKKALTPELTEVNFAFLGAYFFSLQLLFRRYMRRDLSGGAYLAVSLRILLAVLGTWAAVSA